MTTGVGSFDVGNSRNNWGYVNGAFDVEIAGIYETNDDTILG